MAGSRARAAGQAGAGPRHCRGSRVDPVGSRAGLLRVVDRRIGPVTAAPLVLHGGQPSQPSLGAFAPAFALLLSGGTMLLLQAGIGAARAQDRKSTRLNSSHVAISYAVFCLKKKK